MSRSTILSYRKMDDIRLKRVNYKACIDELRRLEKKYDGVELWTIGESDGIIFEWCVPYGRRRYGGAKEDIGAREIYALDILPRKEKKGLVFVVAGHHSVEPAGPAAAIEFGERLLNSDSKLLDIIRDYIQITIIPMVDVDYFSLPVYKRIYGTLNNFYHKLACQVTHLLDRLYNHIGLFYSNNGIVHPLFYIRLHTRLLHLYNHNRLV